MKVILKKGSGTLTSEDHPDVYYCVIEVSGVSYRFEEAGSGRLEVKAHGLAIFPDDNSDAMVLGSV